MTKSDVKLCFESQHLLECDWSLIETPCTLARWSDIRLDFSLTLHSMHSNMSCSFLHFLCAFQSVADGNTRLQAEHFIDFVLFVHTVEVSIGDFFAIPVMSLNCEFLWKYFRWEISIYRFSNERKHFEHLNRICFSFWTLMILTFGGFT